MNMKDILEKFDYMPEAIALFALAAVLVVTFPIWIIPALVYELING